MKPDSQPPLESPQLVFVVSVPRSGSTVLGAILDRREDVVVLPESHFPQLLDLAGPEILRDPDRLARLFALSCPDGEFLDREQARACIFPDRTRTLRELGLAVARHVGRDPAAIRVIVWKATRAVGRWRTLADAGGRFVVLRRHPVNVFESQHRVHFGLYNRNPLRFALFAASYEAAYRRYPRERVFELEYRDIPRREQALLDWIGSRGKERARGASTLERTSAKVPWHSTILGEFVDNDAAKRVRVRRFDRWMVPAALRVFSATPGLGDRLRNWADRREYRALRDRSAEGRR